MKTLALVAHEFGLAKNSGGIASCLYQYARYLLCHESGYEIHVLTLAYDKDCDLDRYQNFVHHDINASEVHAQGELIRDILLELKPDYIETADFMGLCLETLIWKYKHPGALDRTVFIADNHTASQEIFIWNNRLGFERADRGFKQNSNREKVQMLLVDKNIAPSRFLASYVEKNYGINQVAVIPHIYNLSTETAEDVCSRVSQYVDLSPYKNQFVISYITRFEGRKNQDLLVKAFIHFIEETGADALLILAGNSAPHNITNEHIMNITYNKIPEKYLSRIHFYKYIQGIEKDALLCVSDLTVMTSVFENFPVAMTEAVFHGVPVITSRYSGCSDFMEGCREQTTFDPFKEEDVYEKLLQFYLLSKEERRKIADRQLCNLKKLCAPDSAIAPRRKLFEALSAAVFKKAETETPIYISSSQLNDFTADACAGRSIVLCAAQSEHYIKKMLEIFHSKLSEQTTAHVIALSKNGDCFEVMEAVEKGRPLLITHVPYNVFGKRWYELIGDLLFGAQPRYCDIPCLETDINGDYTILKNYLQNKISEVELKDYYGE